MKPAPEYRLALTVAALLGAVLAGNGCQAAPEVRIASSTMVALQRGLTYHALTNIVKAAGTHEFTALLDGRQIHCIRLAFEQPHIAYYFVFEHGRLVKVCERPPIQVEMVPYRDGYREIRKPEDPFQRMARVLRCPDLSGEAFAASLAGKLKPRSESLNVLPAFVLVGPLLGLRRLADTPTIASAYRENARIAQLFDHEKLKLGMMAIEVKSQLGEPMAVSRMADGGLVYAYGQDPPAEVKPEHRASWLGVVLHSDRVTALLTYDFFDDRWKQPSQRP